MAFSSLKNRFKAITLHTFRVQVTTHGPVSRSLFNSRFRFRACGFEVLGLDEGPRKDCVNSHGPRCRVLGFSTAQRLGFRVEVGYI